MLKKIIIDILMEGPGGSMVFKPVKFDTEKGIEKLVRGESNSVIKHNIEKEAKRKRVEL